MKGLRKRAVVLAAVAALAMSSLAGCSRDNTVDNNKVAARVGDSEITLGALNFYLRYDQANVESVYGSTFGENLWRVEFAEGITFESSEKDSILNALTQMYILEDHMTEYGVTISLEEMAKIEETAKTFVEENSEEAVALVSGNQETVVEVLKMCTISAKMYAAMVEDVSTEVSDEEAGLKKVAYLGFTETENITLEEAKEEAELFLEEVKKVGDLLEVANEQQAPAHEINYNDKTDTSVLSKELMDAANKLKQGEFSDVIEVNNIYYVIQLVDEFDEEATEANKAQIVADRQDEKFNEVYENWKKEAVIEIDDQVVSDIDMHGLKITLKKQETTTK